MKTIALGMMALLSAVAAAPAHAAITYDLSGVTFTAMDGTAAGTLTGSFTTNDARTAVTTYNLVASAFGTFTGYTYTPITSSVAMSILPDQYFQLDGPGMQNELRLFFTSGLSATGGTISGTFSYENEPSGGNRLPSGTVVAQVAAVPEAATWAMMIVGLGTVGFAARRRTATVRVTYAA